MAKLFTLVNFIRLEVFSIAFFLGYFFYLLLFNSKYIQTIHLILSTLYFFLIFSFQFQIIYYTSSMSIFMPVSQSSTAVLSSEFPISVTVVFNYRFSFLAKNNIHFNILSFRKHYQHSYRSHILLGPLKSIIFLFIYFHLITVQLNQSAALLIQFPLLCFFFLCVSHIFSLYSFSYLLLCLPLSLTLLSPSLSI